MLFLLDFFTGLIIVNFSMQRRLIKLKEVETCFTDAYLKRHFNCYLGNLVLARSSLNSYNDLKKSLKNRSILSMFIKFYKRGVTGNWNYEINVTLFICFKLLRSYVQVIRPLDTNQSRRPGFRSINWVTWIPGNLAAKSKLSHRSRSAKLRHVNPTF